MGERSRKRNKRRPPSRGRKLAATLGLAFLTAFVTAIASGFGADVKNWIEGEPKTELVSFSADQEINDCGTPLFVPSPPSDEWITDGLKNPPAVWKDYIAEFGAAPADRQWINVSLQGESERAVTITRIRFTVDRRDPPQGARFSNPCGGDGVGRSLVVDMDRVPPAIVRSNDDPSASGGPSDSQGEPAKPMTFPWIVSISDPLLLRVKAFGTDCDCRWKAFVDWQSGKFKGTTTLDDGGKPFRFINAESRYYVPDMQDASEITWRRLPTVEDLRIPE